MDNGICFPQVVLVYKLKEEEEEEEAQEEELPAWRVQHTIKLPCPVLSIAYCDVTGDGCFELVIMTTAGLHIFQVTLYIPSHEIIKIQFNTKWRILS